MTDVRYFNIKINYVNMPKVTYLHTIHFLHNYLSILHLTQLSALIDERTISDAKGVVPVVAVFSRTAVTTPHHRPYTSYKENRPVTINLLL